MESQVEVVAFNLVGGYAVLSNDDVLPITNFFDEYNEPCGPEEAVKFVAGVPGFWIAVVIGDEGATFH